MGRDSLCWRKEENEDLAIQVGFVSGSCWYEYNNTRAELDDFQDLR